jgi:P pilus assembly chaperone PapD
MRTIITLIVLAALVAVTAHMQTSRTTVQYPSPEQQAAAWCIANSKLCAVNN